MWKHIAANVLTLLILGLIVVAGFVAWAQSQYRGDGPLAEAICVRVSPGQRIRSLGDQLEERGAITSAALFRIGADYSDKSDQLKAGSFLVDAGASMEEILDAVTRGGRSTCGTEVVFRVGVASQEVEVRELDPATNRSWTWRSSIPRRARCPRNTWMCAARATRATGSRWPRG